MDMQCALWRATLAAPPESWDTLERTSGSGLCPVAVTSAISRAGSRRQLHPLRPCPPPIFLSVSAADAPPIGDGAPMQWLNRWNPFGGGGGRLTYNVSYRTGPDSVDELYTRVQSLGYATLSYMNVFEFGMNIAKHASGEPVACMPDDYRNATLYAQNHLHDSILLDNWNAEDTAVRPNQGAWDNGVLMDPGRASYMAEMVTQQQRRVAMIPSFQGVVVDRSDYARYYNLQHDDGVTFTGAPGYSQSWSMKRSYLEVIAGTRQALGTGKIMLMNSLGYSSLSFMPSFDGTFSEGKAVNAAGLLGAGGMVNIMWTTSAWECCRTAALADVYLQHRIYMGVFPMAPIPAADHSISYDPVSAGYYADYGPLFAALQGKRYSLAAHAVAVAGPKGTTAVANAFVLQNGTLIYPVVLANTPEVTLVLTSVPAVVAGFEVTHAGAQAGVWGPADGTSKAGAAGTWEVTVKFPADARVNHAAIVRSRCTPRP